MKEDTIAQNLRRIRTEQGLSLSKAAELTGVSKAMLGQIERQESSPTIATLWKIAEGFHVALTALLQESSDEEGPTVRFPGSISVRIVFPFDPKLAEETFEITLKPGQFHKSDAHEEGLIEDVYVLSGTVELQYGPEKLQLEAGRGFRFAADQPHSYRGLEEGAVFLNIHHYARREL